jgi:hypothetical protein
MYYKTYRNWKIFNNRHLIQKLKGKLNDYR